MLTARAEKHLRGGTGLEDTIARLQAFADVGADVLYAPGVVTGADLATVVAAVDRPVNVLALPGVPPVAELARLGVARISVGSAFSLVGYAAVTAAARELLEHGTYDFWGTAEAGRGSQDAFDR